MARRLATSKDDMTHHWRNVLNGDIHDAMHDAAFGRCERAIEHYGRAVAALITLQDVGGGADGDTIRKLWGLPHTIAAACRRNP